MALITVDHDYFYSQPGTQCCLGTQPTARATASSFQVSREVNALRMRSGYRE